MRAPICIAIVLFLSGCASTEVPVEMESFSRSDISVVISGQFDGPQSEAERALKPSYDKFGSPKRYVSGNMSAILETSDSRLYGSGNLIKRFSVARPIFWQIEGEAMSAGIDPIKTVHLLYDKDDITSDAFGRVETETRRGQSFTVFERDLGPRVIVSIYPTEKLSPNAELNSISFQN